jgi:predicted nuclease of predicted toxin-antitoxin system
MLQGRPYKLLLVSTGNIGNRELLELFQARSSHLARLFETCAFLELTRDFIVIHG